MIKASKIKRLPADLYSRNKTFSLIINQIFGKTEIKILDIGGYGAKLSWFLPLTAKLTVFDKKIPDNSQTTNHLVGDALNLPFKDNTFDLVLSSDTLEHTKPENRKRFISEICRVSKNKIILAAPFDSPFTRQAEEYINLEFQKITGSPHPFLSEHRTYGLPSLDEIINFIKNSGYHYIKLGEGNIHNWFLQVITSAFDLKRGTSSIVNKFFNNHFSELGNFRSPTYRTIFLIDKKNPIDPEPIRRLIQKNNNYNPSRFLEALKLVYDDICASTEIQNVHLNQFNQLQSKLFEAEQSLLEFSTKLEQSNQQISIIKAKNSDLTQTLFDRENEINLLKFEKIQKKEELELLKKQITAQENLLSRISLEHEQKSREIDQLKAIIHQKEHNIRQSRSELSDQKIKLQNLENSLKQYRQSLEEIQASRSWKTINFLGKLKKKFFTNPAYLLKRGIKILIHLGPKEFIKRAWRKTFKVSTAKNNLYHEWVVSTELSNSDRKKHEKIINKFNFKPLFSIIMPVYNPNPSDLIAAIKSVLAQTYSKWELCIADDCSTNPEIKKILTSFTSKHKNIRVTFRPQNGHIVKASNSALKLAQGSYIGLLDQDDLLVPNALFEVAKSLQEEKYDLIYSDEDKISIDGKFIEPYFKSDYNQDLLLSSNYFSHFGVYRRKLVQQVGGFRPGTEGSQDYDLILRCTDKPAKIKHIPKILYHWRQLKDSTSYNYNAKPYAHTSAKKSLTDAIKRRHIKAEVLDGLWLGSFRVKRKIQGEPLVSIIIPFRDKPELLKSCINSIFEKTTWKNYEIILINNRSEQFDTFQYMKELHNCPRVLLLDYDAPFNYSAINNFAVEHAKGDYLLLLNNDTQVIEPEWIESMLEHAQRPEVGAVGAKLFYPNNTIQHTGTVIGIGGVANHSFQHLPAESHGYFGLSSVIRNVSAVTAACLMIRKSVYEEVNGFDEENLAVSFNDVDLCLRLRELNYLIVYTPYASLYHQASSTRGFEVSFNEEAYLRNRHKSLIESGDPYYNPNLTLERMDYSLRIFDQIQL